MATHLSKNSIKNYLLILPFILLAVTGFAQTQKDTLFFTNGEKLIGELKQMSQGIASFDDDGVGLINVKFYKLRSIHTTMSTLRIETVEKEWLYGKLVPSGVRDTVYLDDGVHRIKLARSDISSISPLRQRFFDKLDGNLSAGLSFSRSSYIGQFNLNATVKYTSRALQSELTVNELGSIDSTGFSRDQESVALSFYHYFGNSSWFGAAALGYQRNQELSLAHRYQGMLGGGNKFVSDQHFEILALSGLAANTEESLTGVSSQGLLVEIPLIVKLDYFRFKSPNMQISMTNAGYLSLSQTGRYRYDGTIYFSWELISNFYFTTNLYANYDSKPADIGSGKLDYGIVMGISFRF
ncbi:MAG TPA: DUF481 domain-containing protein [Mucilaginibacter sp.]|jgi:hypothetical protein